MSEETKPNGAVEGQPPRKAKVPWYRSLKYRFVFMFAGVALVPFSLSMAILYSVAKHDFEYTMGMRLANEAEGLVAEVESELNRMVELAARVAAEEEIYSCSIGEAPEPKSIFDFSSRLHPSLRSMCVSELGKDEPARHSVKLADTGHVIVRAPIRSELGKVMGLVEADFDPEGVLSGITGFRRNRDDTAALMSPSGVLASSSDELELLPQEIKTTTKWFKYTIDDEVYYAAAAKVGKLHNELKGDWWMVVTTPYGMLFKQFDSAARQISMLMVMLAAVVCVLALRMSNKFLKPILDIRQGAEIISHINFGHRLKIKSGDELELLANDFNGMAESLQASYESLESRVAQVTRTLEVERNRLASVLKTMVEGLVVTNERGEVLLLNPRARLTLGTGPATGIGHPLSKLLPSGRLTFHMRRLRTARAEGRDDAEHFIFALPNGRIIRGVMTNMSDPSGDSGGFLLVFRDVTGDTHREEHSSRLLHGMPEALRSPVTSIKAMVDILVRREDLDRPRQELFLNALVEESQKAALILDEAEAAMPDLHFVRWPLTPADPKDLVEEALAQEAGVFARLNFPDEPAPLVAVEPFSWVRAMCTALAWISSKSDGRQPLEVSLESEEDSVVITYTLGGYPTLDPTEVNDLVVRAEGEKDLNIREAIDHSRGGLWIRRTEAGFQIRLAMVKASVLPDYSSMQTMVGDQPEFYDFDLFLPRPGIEREDQLGTKLRDLEFVVFDTETTGLNLSEGDRTVSLSGVRVRDNKVLSADTFHALVNPERAIPKSSTEIHHITDDMVADAPTIDKVLPQFYEWVGDAVLVAHNAGFDTKLLKLEGDRFSIHEPGNTVIDTLLISYGLHREMGGHNLESIAERLGVEVEGRHTSLGDARTTANILVQFIPLLEARGVVTLADAKAFCDRMLMLRWQSSRY